MKQIFFYLIIILFLSSCYKELEISLPLPEPKLVVNSFLNPDSLFRIHVSKTASVFDTIPEYISDADVKLFENDVFIKKLNYSKDGFYVSEALKPQINKIYSIEIITDEFGLSSAKDTVPKKINNLNCSTTDFIGTNMYDWTYAELTINFTDNIHKDNYYEAYIFNVFSDDTFDEGSTDTLSFLSSWFSNEIAITEENIDAKKVNSGNSILFTDKYFTDGNVNIHINYFPKSFGYDINNEPIIPDYYKILVVVHSVSKQYYKFKQKLNLYDYNQEDFWDVNEAVFIKGNIKNGLGIFAAYTTTIDTLTWDY